MSTLEKWKLIYGFVLLTGLIGMAVMFGWGHVEEKTSYGLSPILAILGTQAGSFSNWAFGSFTKRERPIDSGNGTPQTGAVPLNTTTQEGNG